MVDSSFAILYVTNYAATFASVTVCYSFNYVHWFSFQSHPAILKKPCQILLLQSYLTSLTSPIASIHTLAPQGNVLSGLYIILQPPIIRTSLAYLLERYVFTVKTGFRSPVLLLRLMMCWLTWTIVFMADNLAADNFHM